ncbi:MAG: hypothetical protein GQ577_13600, partial [Woeseiaceae bacterium]|nr:hypothetical protein [Woeseiaceae bacterium]
LDMPVDAKTLRVQQQAEEVYERTDYKRAFFIYRNELVPIGDKFGQYMVGFMYLTGKGVEEDQIKASAWYRVAAERGTKEYVHVATQVLATLDAEQRVESDRLFVELRKEYGDLVLLTKAIRKDMALLRDRTGSRISATTSPMTIIEPSSPGGTRSGDDYYGQIERRIAARLEYIASRVDIDIIDQDPARPDMETIERELAAHLEGVN